jgi:hypothetical protein
MRFFAPLILFPVAAPDGVPPPGAVEYRSAVYTQAIYRLDERPRIDPTGIRHFDAKWHQSGGLAGLTGATSRKFRTLPEGKSVASVLGGISVKNSFGFFQTELGIVRTYPDGTRFDDILIARGGVFEHRAREKVSGSWKSRVVYTNNADRPAGYVPLRQSCDSCHGESGSGGYGVGLVPGGDGVLSDPLDWSLVKREWRTEADVK